MIGSCIEQDCAGKVNQPTFHMCNNHCCGRSQLVPKDMTNAALHQAIIDPDDYYHALKVDHTKVPLCTVKKNVLTGYVLPNMPRRYYLKILWMPNNETLNVWTHLVPLIYYLFMLYGYSQTIDLYFYWPLLILIVGSTVVTICSCLAHVFHSRSTLDHCCWMMLDFFGIITYSYASTISHFFACSQTTHYSRIGVWNMFIFTLNCCIVFPLLCLSKVPNSITAKKFGNIMRVGPLGYGYIYGLLPLIDRLMISGWQSDAMTYHILSFIFMAASAYSYATNKPQSFKPGAFDIIGHNHQIFHIFSALAMYYDILAVHIDVTSPNGPWTALTKQEDHPSLESVGLCGFFIVLWCFTFAVYVGRLIRNDLRNNLTSCHKMHPPIAQLAKKLD